MKKRILAAALLFGLLLSLCACGLTKDREPKRDTPAETAAPATPAPETAAPETPAPETAAPETPAPQAVRVEMTREDNYSSDGEKVRVSGLDTSGATVWEREFTTEYRTELTLIQPIGAWQDRYYLNHNGTVVCLNLADGTTKWENDEFHGASISSLIDERNGNVYLCGYYGPDFFACDKDGLTLSMYPNAAEGFYWPSNMDWNGPDELVIWYYSADPVLPFYVDLSDFQIFWYFGHEDMDADSQYWANIFISDFAEQFISEFPRDSGSDAELSSFARLFCKLNRHDAIVYDQGFETVSLDTVNELCMRFFGREIHPADGAQYENEWGMKWKYENGKFWFPASDGEAYNRFAVVREYLRLNNGDVKLSFDVYEVPLDDYWQNGIDGDCYRLTAAGAEALARTGRIVRVGSGTALTTPIEQNGHDGYFLHTLHIDIN